jgi:hypothetical protein
LAAYCVQQNIQPRNANIRAVQQLLLDAHCYLMPYVDVLPNDPHWEAIQKAGATGLLQGKGISSGWANKMYFYPDSTIQYETFKSSVNKFLPCLPVTDTVIMRPLQVKEACLMLVKLLHTIRLQKGVPHKWPPIFANEQVTAWQAAMPQLPYPGHEAPIKRRELAALMAQLAEHPFAMPINWQGQLIKKTRLAPHTK